MERSKDVERDREKESSRQREKKTVTDIGGEKSVADRDRKKE